MHGKINNSSHLLLCNVPILLLYCQIGTSGKFFSGSWKFPSDFETKLEAHRCWLTSSFAHLIDYVINIQFITVKLSSCFTLMWLSGRSISIPKNTPVLLISGIDERGRGNKLLWLIGDMGNFIFCTGQIIKSNLYFLCGGARIIRWQQYQNTSMTGTYSFRWGFEPPQPRHTF